MPDDDFNPDVLQINIIEIEIDNGKYLNTFMPFPVDLADYAGKKVLAVPRCCQKRKGTTDRARVNESIAYREGRIKLVVATEEEKEMLATKTRVDVTEQRENP